jgi:hypothetical protein
MRWLYGVVAMCLSTAAQAQSVYMDPSNRPDYSRPIVRPSYEEPRRPAYEAPSWERYGRPLDVGRPAYDGRSGYQRRQENYGAPVDAQGRRR